MGMTPELRPAQEQAMNLLHSTLDNFEALASVLDDLIATYQDRPDSGPIIERLRRARAAAERGASIVRDRLN